MSLFPIQGYSSTSSTWTPISLPKRGDRIVVDELCRMFAFEGTANTAAKLDGCIPKPNEMSDNAENHQTGRRIHRYWAGLARICRRAAEWLGGPLISRHSHT